MNNSSQVSIRFKLVVSLSFKTPDGTIAGHTIDVSQSGLLAKFNEPVELWVVGEISLTVGEYYLEIKARVARTLEDGCGLSFLIEDHNDRQAVAILNDYAISLVNIPTANSSQV